MTCPKCHGTGWYAYDHNHSTVCNLCCKHDKGWWELTPGYCGYEEGKDNHCCKAGCGKMRRDLSQPRKSAKKIKTASGG